MICNKDGCEAVVHARGLCQPHYRQFRRHERGLKQPGPKPDPTKWRSRYNPDNLSRSRPSKGKKTHCKYGHELTEDNIYLDSVNRRHCKVCQRERQQEHRDKRGLKGYANSRKTHCAKGHEYTKENTAYGTRNGSPYRICKECSRLNGRNQRFKKYGVTEEWFNETLQKQGGKCAVCQVGLGDIPHIDHNHETGQVRGILCFSCNGAIGLLREDPQILVSAIQYLAMFSGTQEIETDSF